MKLATAALLLTTWLPATVLSRNSPTVRDVSRTESPAAVKSGLTPPARICTSFVATAVSVYACASGARGAVANAIKTCDTSSGEHSRLLCAIDSILAASAATVGAAAVGLGIAYASGYEFFVGQVVEAAEGITLTAQARSEHLLPQHGPPQMGTLAGVIPPHNNSLPTMTWEDTFKNLTFPFHFEHSGWNSTYFPEGWEDDSSLVYTHYAPGFNTTEGIAVDLQREADPASMGLRKVPVVGLGKRSQCGYSRHSVPYRNFPSNTMYSGKGFYYESVAICGHPAQSQSFLSQENNLLSSAVMYANNNNYLVLETRVSNRQNGYTFASNRMVVETDDFKECFDGQHINAMCAS